LRENEMCQSHIKLPRANRLTLGNRRRAVTG
jgi:hypothetical protein